MTGTQAAIATLDRRVNSATRSLMAQFERQRTDLMEELAHAKATQGARLMAELISLEKLIAMTGTRARRLPRN